MPQPLLQCPFCELTSSRAQGLAAHIRGRHAKQYPKWLKTPSRLEDAAKAPVAAKPMKPAPEPPAIAQAVQAKARMASHPAVEANPALDLLKKAHAQLLERRQSIEAELARLAKLTTELETVNTHIEALEKTLGVFESKAVAGGK